MLSPVADLLQQLVRVDTVNPPGNERRAAEILRAWLATQAIEIELTELEPGRANLVARVAGPAPGPRLVFNTHMDVVPTGDGWDRDPLAAEISDGRLYGRGAADAKGSLAAMAVALAVMRERGTIARGEVLLAAVADEEGGSAGARALLRGLQAEGAIIGEPTGLRLMTAHKGSLRPVIEVRGRPAHAAHPEQGVNAIDGAASLLVLLRPYARELAQMQHPLVGGPTLVPVLVDGGEALNMVAARCRITLDRRLVPGEHAAQALAGVQAVLDRFRQEHPEFSARIADLAPTTGGASETPAHDPFVVACVRGLVRAGQDARLGGLTVNCDMTHFRGVGIPTVIYGPGDPAIMHKVNEHISLRELERAVEGYVGMADQIVGPRAS